MSDYNEDDLPLCMQSGFDPETPGREYEARVLDEAIKAVEDGDHEEAKRLLSLINEGE